MRRLLVVSIAAAFAAVVAPYHGEAASGCVTALPDEAAAVQMAARCESRVEVLSARTESSQVFAGSDGKYVLETYAVPQRVRKDGGWADIDPSLHRGGDGLVRPVATLADVTFSGGGTGPVVTVVKDGKRFELSWPSALPAPSIDGTTATYAEVFSGVDLTVEATRTGYRQTLVVKNAAAAANPALSAIRYRVSGDLHVVKDKDGSLHLTDAEGKVSPMRSHASSMWDSSFDPSREGQVAPGLEGRAKGKASDARGAGPGARVAPVAVQVSGEDMLVVPDKEMMSAPTYPVFIDPPFDQWLPDLRLREHDQLELGRARRGMGWPQSL